MNAVVLDFVMNALWLSGTQWVARGAVLSSWMVPPFVAVARDEGPQASGEVCVFEPDRAHQDRDRTLPEAPSTRQPAPVGQQTFDPWVLGSSPRRPTL